MQRIHIIGGKNHGKTTLFTELVEELSANGHRVGTIKHTHHQHELDLPGKDSFRHRQAGAVVSGILSRSMNAMFWPVDPSSTAEQETRYDTFAPMFSDCDLVLVEGDTQTSAAKIEVWRQTLGTPPLAEADPSIIAVVTHDTPGDLEASIWPRADVAEIARRVLALAQISRAD